VEAAAVIYVYCGRDSEGARDLAAYLVAERVGKRARALEDLGAPPGLIVNWGTTRTQWPPGFQVLNPRILANKYRELQRFEQARIPTLPFSQDYREGWLARLGVHEDGNDLGIGAMRGDFYTQLLDIVEEYRVHSFQGRSIGLLRKVPRADFPAPHPVFRCYRHGWTLAYRNTDGWRDRLPAGLRETAHRAVAAVGYDFGAVDIGRLRDGGIVVLEVNSAPGIDGDEVPAYGDALAALAG